MLALKREREVLIWRLSKSPRKSYLIDLIQESFSSGVAADMR